MIYFDLINTTGLGLSVIFIYFFNFIVIINLIFREKRNINTTLSWILILVMIPVLGFIMYISLGRNISKKNMFYLKELNDISFKKTFFKDRHLVENHNLKNLNYVHSDMIEALSKSDNCQYTTNNDITIYSQSNKFFMNLIEELKKSKESINMQFYTFRDDNIGNEIMNILINKARSGIEVRFLYDALGSRKLNKKSIEILKKNGIKVATFFPTLIKQFNLNINFRNHRKIVVIDSSIGFVGGNNIGDEYLGKNSKFGKWRDTHIKLIGDSVKSLNIRFIQDWIYATKEKLDIFKYVNTKFTCPIKNKNGVQIVSSGPDVGELNWIKYGYLKIIQSSKKYVYIQTPYLILDTTFIDTIKIACFSGVDVRIMIPSKPDHPFVYWATYSYAGELLKYGAKIYTYDHDSFLHAKTIVSDDLVCSIGSANMDIRSFELDFEVNAFIYSNEKAVELKHIFENDILKSREITKKIYDSRGLKIKFKESVSRLLSSIL